MRSSCCVYVWLKQKCMPEMILWNREMRYFGNGNWYSPTDRNRKCLIILLRNQYGTAGKFVVSTRNSMESIKRTQIPKHVRCVWLKISSFNDSMRARGACFWKCLHKNLKNVLAHHHYHLQQQKSYNEQKRITFGRFACFYNIYTYKCTYSFVRSLRSFVNWKS